MKTDVFIELEMGKILQEEADRICLSWVEDGKAVYYWFPVSAVVKPLRVKGRRETLVRYFLVKEQYYKTARRDLMTRMDEFIDF